MLLAFCGVTGVGKTHFTNLIKEKLNFERIKIYTTRDKRKNEKINDEKIFINEAILNEMINDNKIMYKFDLLGNTYAYTYESLTSSKNTVFEMHYETIFDFKRLCSDIKTIYLLPQDLDNAINKTKDRQLNEIELNGRIKEINNHFYKINHDDKLKNMFDYIVVNDYSYETEKKVLEIVEKWMNEEV